MLVLKVKLSKAVSTLKALGAPKNIENIYNPWRYLKNLFVFCKWLARSFGTGKHIACCIMVKTSGHDPRVLKEHLMFKLKNLLRAISFFWILFPFPLLSTTLPRKNLPEAYKKLHCQEEPKSKLITESFRTYRCTKNKIKMILISYPLKKTILNYFNIY